MNEARKWSDCIIIIITLDHWLHLALAVLYVAGLFPRDWTPQISRPACVVWQRQPVEASYPVQISTCCADIHTCSLFTSLGLTPCLFLLKVHEDVLYVLGYMARKIWFLEGVEGVGNGGRYFTSSVGWRKDSFTFSGRAALLFLS